MSSTTTPAVEDEAPLVTQQQQQQNDTGATRDLSHEDEEEDFLEESFVHVDEMTNAGANASEIQKLTTFGYTTCALVASASKRELAEIPGLSEDRAVALQKKAKTLGNCGLQFSTALELSKVPRVMITTGSKDLDKILGGGIELQTLTEIYGDSGTGKTQLCLTLCVKVQLGEADGGAAGRALFIDCNGTFRADRLLQIAAASGLGPEQCAANVAVVTVSSFDQQGDCLAQAGHVLADTSAGEFRLLIVDGLMTHLRAEYAGRSDLAARQQHVNAYMRKLKLFATAFNLAVVVTNQVSTTPEAFANAGPVLKPIGGPVLAHNLPTKINFRKARGNSRKVILDQAPHMPRDECLVSITAAGITDHVDE